MRTSLKVVVGTLLLGMLALPARGQQPASTDSTDLINGYEQAAHSSFVGVPTDWTSHHLIFSAPEPGSDAEDKVQQDPRYWLQQIRRSQLHSDDSFATDDGIGALPDKKKKNEEKQEKQEASTSRSRQRLECIARSWWHSRRRLLAREVQLRNERGELQRLRRVQHEPGGPERGRGHRHRNFREQSFRRRQYRYYQRRGATATGVGTDTFTGEPGSGTTTVVGTVTYTWTTTTCTAFTPTATTGCVVRSATTATDATNLRGGHHQYLLCRYSLQSIGSQSGSHRGDCQRYWQHHQPGRRDQHERGRAYIYWS